MPKKQPGGATSPLSSASRARYLPEEDEIILAHYREKGATWVAQQLNRSKLAVQWRAIAIGAARTERGSPANTELHERIIQLRLAGMTIHGAAVAAKCSDSTVKKVWAGYKNKPKGPLTNVWDLAKGDRFCIPGDQRVWTFQKMDGAYCMAVDQHGNVLNCMGRVSRIPSARPN